MISRAVFISSFFSAQSAFVMTFQVKVARNTETTSSRKTRREEAKYFARVYFVVLKS